MPSASMTARCSADCGFQPWSAATTNSTAGAGPAAAIMFGSARSCPGTSIKARRPPDGRVSQAYPGSAAGPPGCPSSPRWGYIPVSACSRVDLP